jgi:hypothetical protein
LTFGKTDYSIDLFKSGIETKSIGIRSANSIIGQFGKAYPKSQKTVLVFETGKDITPKGTNTINKLLPTQSIKPINTGINAGRTHGITVTKTRTQTIPGSESIVEAVTGTQTTTRSLGIGLVSLPSTKTKSITESRQMGSLDIGLRQSPYYSQSLRTGLMLRQAQQPAQALRQTLRIDTALRQSPAQERITGFGTPNSPPEWIPPGIPFVGILPSLGLPLQQYGGGKSKKPKFAPKYFASLKATAFNIHGKMPSKFALSTGLGTRPIIG